MDGALGRDDEEDQGRTQAVHARVSNLPKEDLDAIVAYMLSLKKK